MDQLKEFLRQCIRYRFWISIGVAALFAIIAYFVGSGPVRANAEKEASTIKAAHKDVQQYVSGNVPNDQYKPIVDEKTVVLTKDVNTAWRDLYKRQAPLLTWPDTVQERFRKWGRKWPENTAENAVSAAMVDYIEAYPKYVTEVYKTFHPFDYETGKGIVSADREEVLLRPTVFDITKLPELGKIWAAQERLWIQRTALEVVAQVNKNAKDWDSAIIKQINMLEVGSNVAQDQRSLAKGETLEEAEAIKAPGSETEEAAAAPDTSGAMAGMMQMMMGRRGGGMMSGGMMGGGMAGNVENIYFVKPENDKGQFKVLPLLMSVMIDQDHIQDFLVELENSPMSIQVMDFEMQRPETRVTKPEKGAENSFAGYGGMMGGGYGGMMQMMMGGRRGGMGMSGYGGGSSNYGAMMQMMMGGGRGSMMGMMGGGAGATAARKGTDKRSVDRGKKREDEIKAAESSKGLSLFDPYFNIVEVKIYGQARFYNAPPEEPAEESSPGQVTAETPKTEPAAEPAKTDAAAKTEPTIAEPAKAEATKAEPAKAEPAKAETSKDENSKKEPTRDAAAKTEAAKGAEAKPAAPKS
jgi:hypothetical protein